nr:MAG TPA: DNA helicase [Caudoviricetes sp.]
MIIEVSNTLRVINPTQQIKDWCKLNLTISNPEYAKKARMHLWLGDTPKELLLYETVGKDLILPFGVLRSIPGDVIQGASVISNFAPIVKVKYDGAVPLYDYQDVALNKMHEAKFGILQSPAGSGKTQIGIALAMKTGRRTLWLCHTLDLVKQSKQRAEMYIKSDLIGTIASGKVDISNGITFATVQTISKLDLTQYKDYWDCIIVDEVHRVSGSPTAVTMYRKVLNNLSARHKYGLSATVYRSDGLIKATFLLIGEVVYEVDKSEVADKILQVGIYPVGTGIQIGKSALNTDGTLNYSKLISYLTENIERNQVIVDCIEDGKSSLILSDRLKHLSAMMNTLPLDMRLDAVMISGKMTTKKGKAERDQALDGMRSGKKKYLFATYSLAKEGLDIPRLERLYLTTPQSDYAVITQSIGRIARRFNCKSEPIVYDFVDNIGFLVKKYKKRCSIYKKNKCYFVEGTDAKSQ